MAPQRATTGSDLISLARPHVGEAYFFEVMVPKDNANWKGPWNCSEFISWVVFQSAGLLYGCDRDFGDPATAHAFTGYWERDARALGEIISIDAAARTPGAAVLRIPPPGSIGHVVLSDGNGGTIEAHSKHDGVIAWTLNNRRWDMGILVSGISYTQGAAIKVTAPSTIVYRLATPPMSGPVVRRIQQKLKAAGFDPGSIDGVFGPHTQAAVVAFQLSKGLTADSEVGEITAGELSVELASA